MANSNSGYSVILDTADSEVTGGRIQAVVITNGTTSTQDAVLYVRQDDGTSGAAGSGSDKKLLNTRLAAGSTFAVTFPRHVAAPKLIAGGTISANCAINAILA